jgi:hypothetical protein
LIIRFSGGEPLNGHFLPEYATKELVATVDIQFGVQRWQTEIRNLLRLQQQLCVRNPRVTYARAYCSYNSMNTRVAHSRNGSVYSTVKSAIFGAIKQSQYIPQRSSPSSSCRPSNSIQLLVSAHPSTSLFFF